MQPFQGVDGVCVVRVEATQRARGRKLREDRLCGRGQAREALHGSVAQLVVTICTVQALPGLRGLVHDLIAIVADLVPTEDQSETYPSGIAFVSEQQVCSEVKLRILRGE